MSERNLMQVINVDGIEKCVKRLGFFGGRRVSDVRLGDFVGDAFYERAKRVLATPREKLNLFDRFYLWAKSGELPNKEDAEGIVVGSYEIDRMIPLNSPFASGVGPHQIGKVDIGRMPVEGRERRWTEEARIELHEEINIGIGASVPPLIIHLTYNERGDGRLIRIDYAVSPGVNTRADFREYFPNEEIVRMDAVR